MIGVIIDREWTESLKYYIYWQDQFMKWQRYTTKTNEADARRVMTRKAADGRRYTN